MIGPMPQVMRIGGRALAALLPDLHSQRGPVYSALCDAITALILDGRIAVETRLPSERELATALQISRATVTAAYDALRATGFPRQPHRLRQFRHGAGRFASPDLPCSLEAFTDPRPRT